MSEKPESPQAQGPEPQADSDPVLDAFVDLIDRIAGFEEDLQPEWVDGYLTALMVGPRVVLPSEWLPLVFEDFGRVFADPDDAQKAMQVLNNRWNAIADRVLPNRLAEDPDTLHLRPLMLTYTDEQRAMLLEKSDLSAEQIADATLDGQNWANGFLDAVDAFAADWQPPRKDRAAAEVLKMTLGVIEAIAGDRQDAARFMAEHYKGELQDRDDLVDEMLFYVQELRLYWLEYGHKPEPIRAAPKPGRNEPCFCGSGRKYKHCHGAAN